MPLLHLSSDLRRELTLAGIVAGAAAMAVYMSVPFFAVLVPVAFIVMWFAQRRLLLFALAAFMIVQGALEIQIEKVSETGALFVRYADEVLVAGVFLLLLADHLTPRPHLPRFTGAMPMGLFVVVCLLSAFANDVPLRDTLFGIFMLTKNWVWFIVFSSLKFERSDYRTLTNLLFTGLIALMIFGFIQFASGAVLFDLLSMPRESRFGILRAQSIFVHPLYYASCMALLACLSVGCHLYVQRVWHFWTIALACFAAATTLAVKSLLGLAVALVVVMAAKRARQLAPILAIGAVLCLVFPTYTIDNVSEQFDMYLQDTKTTRAEGYRVAYDILRDAPFLGVGPSRYGGYASMLLDSPVYARYEFINYDGVIYDTVESYWPHLFGETGLLGFACFASLFAVILLTLRRRLQDPTSSPYRRAMCFAAIPMTIVAWTEAFAAANFSDTTTGFVLFGFLGLACSEQTDKGDEAAEASKTPKAS